MSPDALSYTATSTGSAVIELVAGDSSGTPSLTLRHTLTTSAFGTLVFSFDYDFDATVTAVSASVFADPDPSPAVGTSLSGGFPRLVTGGDAQLEFLCSNVGSSHGPCVVDLTLEFASTPNSASIGRIGFAGSPWEPTPQGSTFMPIPEPSAGLMLGLGLAALSIARRRSA